jgi:hypothetical protein
MRTRRRYICARNPHIPVSIPAVIPRLPHITRTKRWPPLVDGAGWAYVYVDLGHGCSGGEAQAGNEDG